MKDVTGFDMSLKKILQYLKEEKIENGLLADVEDIYYSDKIDERVDPPYLWVIEEEVTISQEHDNISGVDFLIAPFTIFGVYYDSNSPEKAYEKSKNLTTRAGKAIEKGHMNDKDKWFHFIRFNSFSPTGVEIQEGSRRINQSSIQYDCIFHKNNLCKYEKDTKELLKDDLKNEIILKPSQEILII